MNDPAQPGRGAAAGFGRYLLAGGVAAACNYASRFVFERAVPFELAVLLAQVVGTVVAFVLMRRLVFAPGSRPLAEQAAGFAVISALSALQTVLVSSAMLRLVLPWCGLPADAPAAPAIAHVVGLAVPAVTSFFGHRRVSFR